MLSSIAEHELLVFWVQLLVIFSTARVLGTLAKKAGLPSVIGELAAGLILGPSVFGAVWPTGFDWFLPDSEVQSALLLAISWFGAAFLLVVAGFETDLDLIQRLGRAAMLITAGSLLVPLVGGLALGSSMPDVFYGPEATKLSFTLFIAVSVGVSALAVVAKILGDLGLLRRDVGQIMIAVGMANDLVGWVILGVIAGLAASGTLSVVDALVTVVGLGGFLLLALTAGQRGVDAGLRSARREGRNLRGALTVAISTMLIFGVITQALGVEAVLGAFVAGVVLARSRYEQIEAHHVIEDMTAVVFAPIFFATAGLRLDLSLLQGEALKWAVLLFLAALGLKMAGSYLGSRLAGLTNREGFVIGAGLNARGALEIIIANVGLSLGVLNRTAFTVIVMVPLFSSLFASVGVRLLARDLKGSIGERERLAREEALERNLLVRNNRILLLAREEPNDIVSAQIVQFAWPSGLGATVLSIADAEGVQPNLEPINNVFFDRQVDVEEVEAEEAGARALAQAKLGYGVIAVGAESGSSDVLDSVEVQQVLADLEVPMIIVRKAADLGGRLPGIFARALVPVVATTSSRAAQELASSLSSQLGTRLMLSHVVTKSGRPDAGANFFGRLRAEAFPGRAVTAEQVLSQAHTQAVKVRAAADTEVRFTSNTPATEIVRHATEVEADLVVVGAQLRNLDDHVSLGTSAEYILKHAPQTVVVVVMPDQRPS